MDNFNLHMNISNDIDNSSSGVFQFEYFNNCNNNTTLLGSHYPLKDNCDVKELNIKSITNEFSKCNSLWNNNTKRKSLVNSDIDELYNTNVITNKNNISLLDENDIKKYYESLF
tara:strand:+ start:106 stop:447 length:342 start_codon:yes stop_codon:yes gene_type:complete